ncbi:MAG TPA: Hsp20/alpha crystallin family protein [Candidatus Polarisedimenticolaceae bacterium]|nr:Hsp20/alpha crystallin family protein [Candidatus Polarisedimenticolaceae bacterium]
MRLVRLDPVREYLARNQEIDPAAVGNNHAPRVKESVDTWAPPVDIFETQEQLVIRAEVPGVRKDDMDVQIENGVLTLHGRRERDTDVQEESAYRLERVYGAFTRSFSLPTTVDAARIAATYKDGVLEVIVPKAEMAKPKRVEINAA